MINGVLFDLDGTLLDCIRPMERAFVEITSSLGVKLTEESRVNVAENLRSILIKRSSPFAGISFLFRLVRYVGLSPHKQLLLIILASKRLKEIANNSPLFPGVPEILEALHSRGIRMGIVTTRSEKEANQILERFSIEKYFGTVVTRDDTERGKPHPDPVILAMKRLNLKSEETVMIGDMPTDIEAGKLAGTKTIGLLLGIFNKELANKNPDALTDSISSLPALIEGL